MLGIDILVLIIPQVIGASVDQGIHGQNTAFLGVAVLQLLGLTLVRGIFIFLQGRWIEMASQGVAYDMRNEIFRKITHLSFSYHDRTETGQLLSRTVQDVERIRFLTGRSVLRLIDGFILLIGTGTAMFWINPRLALLALVTMPFLIHRGYHFSRHFRPISMAIQQQMAVLTTRLEQNLRGSRAVKSFAQENMEIERFNKENQTWYDLSSTSVRIQAVNVPLMSLISNISTVIIIWYGGQLVINNQLTLGELVAFTTYVAQLIAPVRQIGVIIPAISQASASAERLFDILDAQSEVQNAPDAIPLPPVQGHVRFEHVSFGYVTEAIRDDLYNTEKSRLRVKERANGATPDRMIYIGSGDDHFQPSRRRLNILKDIDFEAKPGMVVALLGTTGSGKSSIINLIPRFYDISEGRILIDGHEIRDVTIESLRAQIGIVLQETNLFATTIRENIAFGRSNATEEEIIEAAKAAQAHAFIETMPLGYDTLVGERGVTLSGGQKQRVAIARTILKNPRILILDDATSAVDTETEHLIQLALERLMHGGPNSTRPTSFVVAQRLSTVRNADLILIMEKGRIVARGMHDELMKSNPTYAEIYRYQLRPEEDSDRATLHLTGSGRS
ncbi:MAG: ABC transporter ATP-binding protein [Chloroflexi bacterium]|nr:ABC transporter ATP-binding protein [Chloroflexota bacterium]